MDKRATNRLAGISSVLASIVAAGWWVGAALPRPAAAHEFAGAHGTVVLDWELPNIRRVLASGYGDSFGTEAWARKGFPESEEIDGRQCMDGSYFLFDVDDEFAFDAHQRPDSLLRPQRHRGNDSRNRIRAERGPLVSPYGYAGARAFRQPRRIRQRFHRRGARRHLVR